MPGATDLLATWEAGLAAPAPRRAVLLHALARPEPDGADGLRAVTVGQRDRELFALRRKLFGEQLHARTACPACGVELEFDFDVANVLLPEPAEHQTVWIEAGRWRVRWRLPTVGDLLDVAEAGPGDARRMLLGRCVLEVDPAGELTPAAQARLLEAAAAADPGSDVQLEVPCVDCGHRSKASVDIVSYLWTELDAWARAVLFDVHRLASAYGWNEAEVLALSPTRRRYYVELVGYA